MSRDSVFRKQSEGCRTVILDGGFATALEAAGFDLSTPLWSAAVLSSDPAAVQRVHEAFAAAGAQIIESGSYQLSAEGCKHEGVADWERLARLSVWLASQTGCVVAGSLGPLGAAFHDGSEYTGFYGLESSSGPVIPITHELKPGKQTLESIRAFHEPRARALRTAGADVLAFETIPCVLEVRAIAQLVVSMRADAWISLSVRDEGHLVSGEPIAAALAAIDAADPECSHVLAVGVNCCPPHIVEGCVRTMAALLHPPEKAARAAAGAAAASVDASATSSSTGTSAVGTASPSCDVASASASASASAPVDALRLRRRIVVYPNRGEVWDAATGTWRPPASVAASAAGSGLVEASVASIEADAAGSGGGADAATLAASADPACAPCAGHDSPVSSAAPPQPGATAAATDDEAWLAMAARWRDAGAWAIGGCCRVPPSLIAALRKRLLPPAAAAP